jgi:hypothetical protein
MNPWNEVDGYQVTESDTVMAALFCKEVKDCLFGDPVFDSVGNRVYDSLHVNKCCDLISRWLDVLCGELVWFQVCDLDRGSLGKWDFAIVVAPNNGKEPLMDEAIRRMQILCQWYDNLSIEGHEGTIEIAVCLR